MHPGQHRVHQDPEKAAVHPAPPCPCGSGGPGSPGPVRGHGLQGFLSGNQSGFGDVAFDEGFDEEFGGCDQALTTKTC